VELILIDSSIWVDHLNRPVGAVVELIASRRSLLHPYVLAEVALGNLPRWEATVKRLRELPSAEPLPTAELIDLVPRLELQGSGLGFVDAHLLAWAVAAPGRRLWTRDRRLRERAEAAGVAWSPSA
jgi:predicted nucleic acid-binding protein